MENVLLHYMEKRLGEEFPLREGLCGPHPFVTISREFGCPSKKIAGILAEKLNHLPGHEKNPKWKEINKEIIQEAAQQLNLDPMHIRYLFQSEQMGFLDDILSSFYLNSKSTMRIKKAVHDVIRSFAMAGYVVIVGRAGAAITRNCSNGLHIRLQAPLEWRVQQVTVSRGITADEARKLANEMDKKRKIMMETFYGNKFDLHIFDLIYNCHTFSREEIAQSILNMMENKKMI
ncbi:MAG: AAA family ATPase [Syntrophothermus sp.]